MVIRFVSAKDPESITDFFSSFVGAEFSIVSGPIWTGDKWFVWYSGKNPKHQNVELD